MVYTTVEKKDYEVRMTKTCEYEHEGFCTLEHFLLKELKKGEKYPCKFAKWESKLKILRHCKAKESDLIEIDDD
jgi:hypothetical protein